MNEREAKRRVKIPKWQICTEGITEANYLNRYIKEKGIEQYVIVNCNKARIKGCGRQHESLLDRMQECGRKWNVERIFLVHDYDRAVEQPSAKQSFNTTFSRALNESNITVIYSNPCFEYWLLLHLDYLDSDLHRHICQDKVKEKCNKERLLRKLSPLHDDDYKADLNLFEYFGGMDGVCKARVNAKKRFKNETYPHASVKCSRNAPCTNMFVLLDELDEFANRIHSIIV